MHVLDEKNKLWENGHSMRRKEEEVKGKND